MIVFEDHIPAGYVPLEQAAAAVNRKPRTIYDWINIENIRTYRQSNKPALVNLADVLRIDALRLKGRRRKPRLPTM